MSKAMEDDDGQARTRINASEIDEGDRVFMGINLHGSVEHIPDAEYDRGLYKSGVSGTVTEALSDCEKELLEDGGRPMADLKVETDDGHVFTWNVDNGYVIGPHEQHRRMDVGKVGGFYTE